ncbi:MAG: exonuclease domain-containing protein [Pseudomonadota bacterium]
MHVERWSLRLRIFLFFALIALTAAAAIGGAMWFAAGRIEAAVAEGGEPLPHLVLAGGGAAFAIVVLTAWIWQLFDENVAQPITRLSGEMEARAAIAATRGAPKAAAPAGAEGASGPYAGGASGPCAEGAFGHVRYLGALGPATERLVGALDTVRGRADTGVALAVDEVLAEKAQLEAVLRDLRECVLICNAEHEVLLYNREAQRLFGDAALGLGRSLFRLVTETPVAHAMERLRLRFTSGRYRTHRDYLSVAVTCATRDGSRTLHGRIALVLDAAESRIDGFVATLHDATAAVADQAARDHLLKDMLESLRRPAANLGTAVEVMGGTPDMDDATRARFLAVLREEAGLLSARIDRLSGAYEELRVGGWSMGDVTTTALAACIADRLAGEEAGVTVETRGPLAWLNCDSLSIVELLALLARRIAAARDVARLGLAAERRGAHVFLDLSWAGEALSETETERWLAEPLGGGLGGLTGRDVLGHHRTDTWSDAGPDGRAWLHLPLPPAVEDHESAPAAVLPTRPEFYDFTLLHRRLAGDLGARRLAELDVVVFDTETTGLFPSAGDEIVQIAGVRVVSNRVLGGEVFDRLVDPGRRIPAAATRVHGIDDTMVAGQPDARVILPAFHDFVGSSVLVAHNAPFDMTFLRLKEGLVGCRFDMAVLDTVLLSAHLFGHTANHTLDALAARLDVRIPAELRHTAIGDARVTAEVFCRLVLMLEGRGVATLADAMAVSDEAGAIRAKQARY